MKLVQILQIEAARRNKEEVFLTDTEPSQEQWGLDLKHNQNWVLAVPGKYEYWTGAFFYSLLLSPIDIHPDLNIFIVHIEQVSSQTEMNVPVNFLR